MIASSRSSSRRRSETRDNKNSRGGSASAAARYDVLERSGEGTIFVVYRVRDKKTRAICALKALKGAYSRHSKFGPAIMREAQGIATLRHTHITSVIEADREDGTVFLVEDWMPGGSLETRLRRAPLPREGSTLLAAQLCDALAAIHKAGFVHGDFRPRQVLYDAAGQPHLNDIGFAPAFETASMSLADIQYDAVSYLAPERFDGKNASQSADLYALGVTLYRALTGRVPFDGPSAVSIAMRHRNDQPLKPTQFNADCPPLLEAAVLRLLAKNPRERYASTEQLLAELAPGKGSTPSKRIAPTPSPIVPAVTVELTPITPPTPIAAPPQAIIEEPPAPVEAAPVLPPQPKPSTPFAGAEAAALPLAAATGAAAATVLSPSKLTPSIAPPVPVAPKPPVAPAIPVESAPPVTRARPAARPKPQPRPVVKLEPKTAPVPVVEVADTNGGGLDDDLDNAVRVRQEKIARRKHGQREILGAFLAFFWLLIAAGLLFGVCYGAYRFWVEEAPPEIRVPRYVGLNQNDAERVLVNSGLQMRVGKEIYNPKKPAGMVLIGDPPPGKLVRKGRLVLVTVSRGEEPVRMVDFGELTLEQARTIINRHGMRLGQIAEQYHDRVPKGYVCGQFPEPDEMFRRSDPINLVLSRGPQPSSVAPDKDALPLAPSAPRLQDDDDQPAAPTTVAPTEQVEDTLVSRGAVVSVALPANGGPQEVKIVVRDAEGEHTDYQQTHDAGEVIEKPIQVIRSQGSTALVRIYVGGKLLRELRV